MHSYCVRLNWNKLEKFELEPKITIDMYDLLWYGNTNKYSNTNN